MIAVLAMLAAAAVPIAAVDGAAFVSLHSRDVAIGDVASVSGPATAVVNLRKVVIARLPEGRERIGLSRVSLAFLIRRAVPGLAVRAPTGGVIDLVAAIEPRLVRAAPSSSNIALPIAPTIKRGDHLFLRSSVGPITIDRPVTALQSARYVDERLFVHTDDGEVLAVHPQTDQGGMR